MPHAGLSLGKLNEEGACQEYWVHERLKKRKERRESGDDLGKIAFRDDCEQGRDSWQCKISTMCFKNEERKKQQY